MTPWTDEKRQRFRALQELPEPRTAPDQAELDALIREVEAAEAAYLSAATRRMRAEREETERRVRVLESLAARRLALAERLEKALDDARAEQRAIQAELASVLSNGSAVEE
jgi:hypothetical protein